MAAVSSAVQRQELYIHPEFVGKVLGERDTYKKNGIAEWREMIASFDPRQLACFEVLGEKDREDQVAKAALEGMRRPLQSELGVRVVEAVRKISATSSRLRFRLPSTRRAIAEMNANHWVELHGLTGNLTTEARQLETNVRMARDRVGAAMASKIHEDSVDKLGEIATARTALETGWVKLLGPMRDIVDEVRVITDTAGGLYVGPAQEQVYRLSSRLVRLEATRATAILSLGTHHFTGKTGKNAGGLAD